MNTPLPYATELPLVAFGAVLVLHPARPDDGYEIDTDDVPIALAAVIVKL
jgi:hypothetical protein